MQNMQHRSRQAFHHPRTSLCGAGHWFNLAGLVAPLVIGEMIKDPDARWRAIRISAVVTAVLSGTFWRDQVKRRREAERDSWEPPQIPR
jgi:hypothetical protein